MKRAWLTLSCLTITLAAASTAHAAAWLTPPQPISGASPAARLPLDVAVDPAKDVFAAWERGQVIEVGVRQRRGRQALRAGAGAVHDRALTPAVASPKLRG